MSGAQLGDKLSFKVVVAIDFGTTYSGICACVYNPLKESKWHMLYNKEWKRNCQTKTQILLGEDGKFIGFGDEVPKLMEQREKKGEKVSFFKRFKMCLWDSKTGDVRKDGMVEDHRGVSHPAHTVFVPALEHLAKTAKGLVKLGAMEEFKDEDYFWVLTVPAIWSQRARLKMKEWARAAGLWKTNPNQFELALEPEAASLACLVDFCPPPRVPFLVLDCGGGTVDVVAHYMDAKSKGIHEVVAPFGNDGGSTCIDQAFIDYLTSVFTKEVVAELMPTKAWIDIVTAWINAKEAWKPENDLTIMFNQKTFQAVEKAVKKFGKTVEGLFDAAEIIYDEESFVIPEEQVKNLFRASVNKITSLLTTKYKEVQAQLNGAYQRKEIDSAELKYFMLVGGLCESKFIVNEVGDFLKTSTEYAPLKIQIKQPIKPVLAVLEGAGRHGCSSLLPGSEKAILSRISPTTYGVVTAPPWIAGTHPIDKKVQSGGSWLCKDVFTKMIEEGQRVEAGDSVEKIFVPVDTKQAVIQVYQSAKTDTKFVTDPGVSHLGEITVPLKGATTKTHINVKFVIGSTSLSVLAWQKDTGESLSVNLTINLTGTEAPKPKAVTSSSPSDIIFVIDRSGSMETQDIVPKSPNAYIFSGLKNRLGAVLDSVANFITKQTVAHRYSLIAFESTAKTIFEAQPKDQYPQMLRHMLTLAPTGGTDFNAALTEAQSVLLRRGSGAHTAKIFLLSDGEASSPKAKALEIKKQYPGLSIWTVKFSGDGSGDAVLKEIASIGGGQYVQALDAIQLEAALELFAIQELGMKS